MTEAGKYGNRCGTSGWCAPPQAVPHVSCASPGGCSGASAAPHPWHQPCACASTNGVPGVRHAPAARPCRAQAYRLVTLGADGRILVWTWHKMDTPVYA